MQPGPSPARTPSSPPAADDTTVTVPQAFATHTRAEAKTAMMQVLGNARHAVAVHTHHLDPGLLDDADVLAVLRRLAVAGRGATLRFLLHDPARVLRESHRLLPLAQRLPSAIELRVPLEDDDLAYASAFMLNDADGYLLRPLATRFDGRGSTCAPGEHRTLLRYFDEVWGRSAPAEGLRPLGI